MTQADPGVEVRPSAIHGQGAFATRAFAPDETIGAFRGEPVLEDGPHVLWIEPPQGGTVGIACEPPLRFVNHHDDPNCEVRGLDLVALRRIAASDELTIHYGPEWSDPQ